MTILLRAFTCMACLIGSVAAGCTFAQAQMRSPARNLVAFYGGEARTPAVLAIDRTLREAFRDYSEEDLQFYSEYIDVSRFDGPEQARRLATFLRDRYAGKKVDLVFAGDPPALQFLLKFRDEILPGVPVVFMLIRKETLASLDLPRDFLGSTFDIEAEPVVRLALALRPATRQVIIVTGTTDLDRSWEARLRRAVAALAPSLDVRVLSGLSIEDIERQLAAAAPESIVLGGTFRRDGAGHYFPGALVVLERLSPVSGAPIFHVVKDGVDRGAVGSAGVSWEASAEQAAGIAKAVLAGTRPDAIPIPAPLAARSYVDWRQLRRWKIDEALLPPDAVVMFREPSFWEQYRDYAVAFAALFLLQTALITALLVQARNRKRAELETHRQRQELAHLSRVTMLAAMSVSLAHELNQPLGAILSNAQAARMFLDRDPADLAEVGESLDAIIRNDQRASEIIRALRRMLVKEDVPKQELAMGTVIGEAMNLLGSELIVRRITIDTQIADNCPRVMGDRIQLQQVLVNLVLNACDAMESNTTADRIVIVRAEKTDRGVRVSVEDRGKGVPPALLEGNFTPFVTTKTHGMGLGLSVCSSIIESHGGHLRVTNKESGGAVFTFELPASARHVRGREPQTA